MKWETIIDLFWGLDVITGGITMLMVLTNGNYWLSFVLFVICMVSTGIVVHNRNKK